MLVPRSLIRNLERNDFGDWESGAAIDRVSAGPAKKREKKYFVEKRPAAAKVSTLKVFCFVLERERYCHPGRCCRCGVDSS